MDEARKLAREKAIEQQRLKQADPAWRAAQYEKKKQSAQRQQARQREKLASPEYRDKLRQKRRFNRSGPARDQESLSVASSSACRRKDRR